MARKTHALAPVPQLALCGAMCGLEDVRADLGEGDLGLANKLISAGLMRTRNRVNNFHLERTNGPPFFWRG